ncbi:MAG: hypothetical protein WCK00_12985, partial [Deltaproteobacteria bacterium]
LGLGEASPPAVRFPRIEKAAESLFKRSLLTRPQYDLLTANARQAVFTVAYVDDTAVIGKIRDALAESAREGATLPGFRAKVLEKLGESPIGPSHLENVYRTGLMSAFRDGKESLAQNPIVRELFPFLRYIATHDGRVRDNHLALETLGIDGSDIYYASDPCWDFFTPGWDFNCVLPGQVVSARNVQLAFRAFYEGAAVEIETDSGHVIRVTANHGIPTDQGIVNASGLQQGAKVFTHLADIQGRRPILQEHVDHEPTTIENVFRSLAEEGPTLNRPSTSLDFHGDAQRFEYGNVDAVGPMLTNWYGMVHAARYAMFSQLQKHRHVVARHGSAILKYRPHYGLPVGFANFTPAIPHGFGPVANVDTSIYESGADNGPGDSKFFSDGNLRHPLLIQGDQLTDINGHRVRTSLTAGLVRNVPRQVFQPIPYRTQGNPEFVSQLLQRHSGFVKVEQVRRVRHFDFRGHVYDLQTSTGWMGINNMIVQQCRCSTILLRVADAARMGVQEAKRWLETGHRPANPTYCLDKIKFRPKPGFGMRHGPLLAVS